MRGLNKKPHGEWTDTDKEGQTDQHRHSMIDPAQRAESVKKVTPRGQNKDLGLGLCLGVVSVKIKEGQ